MDEENNLRIVHVREDHRPVWLHGLAPTCHWTASGLCLLANQNCWFKICGLSHTCKSKLSSSGVHGKIPLTLTSACLHHSNIIAFTVMALFLTTLPTTLLLLTVLLKILLLTVLVLVDVIVFVSPPCQVTRAAAPAVVTAARQMVASQPPLSPYPRRALRRRSSGPTAVTSGRQHQWGTLRYIAPPPSCCSSPPDSSSSSHARPPLHVRYGDSTSRVPATAARPSVYS